MEIGILLYFIPGALVLVGILLYFIPSMVAWGKSQQTGVVILNIFLGWTLLGWIIALIWAVSDGKTEVKQTIYQSSSTSTADEILKLKSLLDSGAITKEEFEREKTKIMR